MSIVHITPGPKVVRKSEPAGDKWCFGCRARYPHTWELLDYDYPSYYEPIWLCRCSNCGHDRTTFPS